MSHWQPYYLGNLVHRACQGSLVVDVHEAGSLRRPVGKSQRKDICAVGSLTSLFSLLTIKRRVRGIQYAMHVLRLLLPLAQRVELCK